MKINIIASTCLALVGLLVVANTTGGTVVNNAQSSYLVQVSTSKQTYVLGEKVNIEIKVENLGREILKGETASAKCGYLRIQIADKSKVFKDYFGPRWQTENCEVVLPQKENDLFTSNESIFWNAKPDVSHLSVDAGNRVSKNRIMTDYAFPDAGTYFIKTILSFPDASQPKIGSEPVQIRMENPVGEDLEVWNKLKLSGVRPAIL